MISTAYRNAIIASGPLAWTDTFIVATSFSVVSAFSLSALYLVKSALGINLMPGPSALHDLLYWMLV